uniref:Alternative protein SH3KBP1 n=1 Tax=Homo sapiens TaxID=9606 RepID=L0R6P6_HUMAN|nr:alternative protein SH3KBP1 [Homo sapiens]
MLDVFLKSCFVSFLSLIVKLLNINRFAQPQRMRVDNTEEVMQKQKITLLIIDSITNKCLFLSLPPFLPLPSS